MYHGLYIYVEFVLFVQSLYKNTSLMHNIKISYYLTVTGEDIFMFKILNKLLYSFSKQLRSIKECTLLCFDTNQH
jgi:hypothetical protein